MRVYTITNQFFDEENGCSIFTLNYENGFKFKGQVALQENFTEGLSPINIPKIGKIFFNDVEIFSGELKKEIQDYFEEFEKTGKIIVKPSNY